MVIDCFYDAILKNMYMNSYSNPGYGYQSDFSESSPHLNRVKKFLKQNYLFRKNEILDQLEYKSTEMEEFQVVDKYFKNSLLFILKDNHLFCKSETLDMLLNSEFSVMYNPFKDFIKNLPEWDNVDYIKQLANTINTNDNELFENVLKKWCVGMTGSLSSDDVINHLLLILARNQNMEITEWIRRLVPQELKSYYYEGVIIPTTIEEKKKFAEKAIIYLIELQPKANQKEFEKLKLFIASKEKIKKNYSKNKASRSASVIGTTEQNISNDIVGNKMVICFEVNSVNYNHQIPIEMIFAQATYLYKNGFPYQFDISEITQMSMSQGSREGINIQDLVSEYIEPSERNVLGTIVSTPTEIAKYLVELAGIERNIGISDIIKLGKYLTENNFVSFEGHSGKKRYCYKLKESGN